MSDAYVNQMHAFRANLVRSFPGPFWQFQSKLEARRSLLDAMHPRADLPQIIRGGSAFPSKDRRCTSGIERSALRDRNLGSAPEAQCPLAALMSQVSLRAGRSGT